MTVGIAAIADKGTGNPKVIVSSDRLVTTRQQSAIEHEHPETKIEVFGEDLNSTNLVGVVAGSIDLGETLVSRIDSELYRFTQENNEEPWVSTSADIASSVYRRIVQDKIENLVLSDYGLELNDLSRQHQFKDEFLNDILSEVSQLQQTIQQNLTLLLGGTSPNGVGVYQISNGDSMPKNNMGYCAIGSGIQPAQSEFIKSDYSRSNSLTDVLATMTAAHYQAEKASGVGGDPDFVVITPETAVPIDEQVVGKLVRRQEDIAEKQKQVQNEILSDRPIDWEPDQ